MNFSGSINIMTPDEIKAHDALNEKIFRDAFKNRLLGAIRDALFSKEIKLKEFNFWVAVIENGVDESLSGSVDELKKELYYIKRLN